MKKYFRYLQTYVPFLHDWRFNLRIKRILRSKVPHDPDFWYLRQLNCPADRPDLLDIGANRGEALASILALGPAEAQIHAFEPNPLVCEKLRRQLGHSDRVEIHHAGLGSQQGNLELHVPVYRNWHFDGLASFIPEAGANWLRARMWRFREKHLRVKRINCPVQRLDDYSCKPFFVKIDVEGFEAEVLKGGLETLRSYRPILLIETVNEEAQGLLRKLDYSFHRWNGTALEPGFGKLNTYCLPNQA